MSPPDISSILENTGLLQNFMPAHIVLSSMLARGGQGVVHKGNVGGATSAVKIYLPGQVQRRIDREIGALQDLTTPRIVDLVWAGIIDISGRPFQVVATSFVEGTPLDAELLHRKLAIHEIEYLIRDVTEAIDAMWSRKIVHRDLKPSNLILKSNGEFCVIDLGIARHTERSAITDVGSTWGTRGYCSPEQLSMRQQLTCKSDIYALGVIALESFLGHHPTHGDQARLFTQNYHTALPPIVSGWRHSALLQSLLHPRAACRPMPETILRKLGNTP
jgi:serine/threonine-protein kinase